VFPQEIVFVVAGIIIPDAKHLVASFLIELGRLKTTNIEQYLMTTTHRGFLFGGLH
jgi:hypothetical protein